MADETMRLEVDLLNSEDVIRRIAALEREIERLRAVISSEASAQEYAAAAFARSRKKGTLKYDPENNATATAVRLRAALADDVNGRAPRAS